MTTTLNLDPRLEVAIRALFDKKAMNITAIDVRGLSSITDFMVIAEGFVDRHVVALAQAVETALKEEQGIYPLRVEGKHVGDWVVMDYFDFMIHLFAPGFRDRYELEKLWPQAKWIDLSQWLKATED